MFNKEIIITGKHAYYMKFLSPQKSSTEEYRNRIFDRYMDVYMNAAVIGFIYGEKEEIDRTIDYKDAKASLFTDVVQKEKQNLLFIYRIIMLLENKKNTNEEERIERAFKDDSYSNRTDRKLENLELFNSYVRGGITYLYNKINAVSLEERIDNINEFVEDFQSEFILEKYLEDIVYEEDKVY